MKKICYLTFLLLTVSFHLAWAQSGLTGTNYQAVLFRRTFPELEKNLIIRSHDLYPRIGGRYNEQKKTWTFPDGERVLFSYLQNEKDLLQHMGVA